jgi:two-component system chemotaxis response regulator CheB
MSASVTVTAGKDRVAARPEQPHVRVMLVDDSAVIRGVLSRWFLSEPDIVIAASVRTGREAIDQMLRADPDVVVLDIEMPELDGLSALPQLLRLKPDVAIVMASTLTRRNAEISMKALALGASDYIPKPESLSGGASNAETFRRDLIDKVRALGTRRRVRLRQRSAVAPVVSGVRTVAPAFTTRPFRTVRPQALVIGSSTGGPQALMNLMASLGPVIARYPVLITQHMPATFTALLAEHLARVSGFPGAEARDGEAVAAGRFYVAPGGRHMRVVRQAGAAAIALDDAPPVNFCRPAVDPLFRSAAEVWRDSVAALILTGMGSDGALGAKAIADAGGTVLAQDEASSVVWGMPGAAVHLGVCAAVLPLAEIAPKIKNLFAGERL